MGQIIKVQRPVSSTSITGLYVISEATFTIALLGVLLYKYIYLHVSNGSKFVLNDRIPLLARYTQYNIMWYSLSVTCDRSVVFSVYSDFLYQ
jgi:hypothetical protein